MEGHDGEELAGFGEDEGDVADVFEAGVAEGRGEGGGDRHERQWGDDGAGGEDGWGFGGCAGGIEEVGVADKCGESGLDRVEEDGVCENFGGGWGTVGGGGYAFLEEGP